MDIINITLQTPGPMGSTAPSDDGGFNKNLGNRLEKGSAWKVVEPVFILKTR